MELDVEKLIKTIAYTLNKILEKAKAVIARIESGGAGLEGLMPRPIFKRN